MVTTAALGLDVYQQARTQANLRQVATAYADYVSRDKDLSQDDIYSLADFLHKNVLDPLPAAFVMTAVEKKASGAVPSVLWDVRHQTTPGSDPDPAQCSRVLSGTAASLPDGFTMEDNEVIVVAEVCVERDGDFAYAHHILPARAGKPDAPKQTDPPAPNPAPVPSPNPAPNPVPGPPPDVSDTPKPGGNKPDVSDTPKPGGGKFGLS